MRGELLSYARDPMELPRMSYRWNPTQSVRTILLSVQSLLNEPNTSSAANVDASVMYRKMKEGKKGCNEYSKIVQEQVELSRKEAVKDNVTVTLHPLMTPSVLTHPLVGTLYPPGVPGDV